MEKSGFYLLGNTVRGYWMAWKGYGGEDFDATIEAPNELTWHEVIEHAAELWDAYADVRITPIGVVDLIEWLAKSGAPLSCALSIGRALLTDTD